MVSRVYLWLGKEIPPCKGILSDSPNLHISKSYAISN